MENTKVEPKKPLVSAEFREKLLAQALHTAETNALSVNSYGKASNGREKIVTPREQIALRVAMKRKNMTPIEEEMYVLLTNPYTNVPPADVVHTGGMDYIYKA